jgi:hypothetical protein
VSYYYFCKDSLRRAPRSGQNFPRQHPIVILTDDRRLSVSSMVARMTDEGFLRNRRRSCNSVNIYNRAVKDVFPFMARTGFGFWTWTMMYHFACVETSSLMTRSDVLNEAKRITRNVEFIRQDRLDEDVRAVIGLAESESGAVNQSSRPRDSAVLSSTARTTVQKVDGDVARILGKYA